MSTRFTTPFGATTTATDVIAGIDLTGKRAVVTGASSGLGEETARVLATAGADVTIAVRNLQAGTQAAARIIASSDNPRVHVSLLDLADQRSVKAFVAEWEAPLDILVDNAGVMANPETRTAEGWEIQFATNHLGHFALTVGLHDALAAVRHSRVVVLSSVGHINGPVRFHDLDFVMEPYDPWLAYAQSKTANILFAVEAARRWETDGIAVNALNPGRIWNTNLGRHIETPPPAFDPKGSTGVSEKTVEQGAATSILLAASPLVEGVTGKYFEDCNEAVPYQDGVRRGVKGYALDFENARKLWEISVERTGVDA